MIVAALLHVLIIGPLTWLTSLLPTAGALPLDGLSGYLPYYDSVNRWLPLSESVAVIGLYVFVWGATMAVGSVVYVYRLLPAKAT